MKEEQKQPETQESEVPNLVKLLEEFDNSPGAAEIEKWKQQFGEVFVSGFSETDIFVWRPLNRKEYVELQKKMRTPAQENEQQFTDLDFEEAVVNQCILWSSDEKILKNKGGSISTLSEQIMTNSNFMAPAMASVLVMKL